MLSTVLPWGRAGFLKPCNVDASRMQLMIKPGCASSKMESHNPFMFETTNQKWQCNSRIDGKSMKISCEIILCSKNEKMMHLGNMWTGGTIHSSCKTQFFVARPCIGDVSHP